MFLIFYIYISDELVELPLDNSFLGHKLYQLFEIKWELPKNHRAPQSEVRAIRVARLESITESYTLQAHFKCLNGLHKRSF